MNLYVVGLMCEFKEWTLRVTSYEWPIREADESYGSLWCVPMMYAIREAPKCISDTFRMDQREWIHIME